MCAHFDFRAHIRQLDRQFFCRLEDGLDQLLDRALSQSDHQVLVLNEAGTIHEHSSTASLGNGLGLFGLFMSLLLSFIIFLLGLFLSDALGKGFLGFLLIPHFFTFLWCDRCG